ncbi:MAG: urea transporter [Verrucomicrobiales bacterium]
MNTDNQLPLWRQILRGFSQCAFQANEIAGVCFIAAVAVFNWRMAIFFVVSVILGTLAARLLKGIRDLTDLGLYGFNSGLMGLALGNFFHQSPALWATMVVLAILTAALAVAMSKWLPFPFLAAPFISLFWSIWPLSGSLGLAKIDFGAFPAMPVAWGQGIFLSTLAAALFSSGITSGLLFLAGIAISNWRHAIVAVIGAVVANALAAQAGVPGGPINTGLVGFNGVLAALAAYVLVAADLRLAVLGSLLATWLLSYIARNAPVPFLASGFVLAIWFLLFLAWLNPRFSGEKPPGKGGTAPKEE